MMKIYYFIWQIITKSFLSVSQFTTEVPVEKSLLGTTHSSSRKIHAPLEVAKGYHVGYIMLLAGDG